MTLRHKLGIVVIGRNEGERLKACLAKLPNGPTTVYVDSGSQDGSVEFARGRGIDAFSLTSDKPFTAARGRNAGICHLLERHPDLEFIQTVDGDCLIDDHWLEKGVAALEAHPTAGVVFGSLREVNPEGSLYNYLCDRSWNAPVGEAESCGGIAMHRVAAIRPAGGFDETLIAGEESDLCLKIRKAGWSVLSVDAEMGLHDAAIFEFGQWRRRMRRTGYAYAEHVARNGKASLPSWKREVLRFSFWGLALPLFIVFAAFSLFFANRSLLWLAAPLSLYLLQFFRIWRRERRKSRYAIRIALLTVYEKFAELAGAFQFLTKSIAGKRSKIIEYK